MPDNASPFVIRPARAADKDPVLAFCKRTFDWGDYLHLVWDGWFTDGMGPLLVATVDEQPVGVAKVTLVTPTEAWLQGLRIHPAYRRRGLAWQFQRQCLDAAGEMGASVARLATASWNAPVHKMSERTGMRRVAEVQVLRAPAASPGASPGSLAAATLEDWPQVSKRILDGPALSAMAGLYETNWMWHALTGDKLRAHLARGQVLAVRDEGGIGAAAVVAAVDAYEPVLPVGHADGAEPYITRLAFHLRERAAAVQAKEVEVTLPADPLLLQAFVQAGYKPEDEGGTTFYIYELDLKGAAR